MRRVLESIDVEEAEEADDMMNVDQMRAELPYLTPDSDEDISKRKKKEKKSKKEKKADKKAAKEQEKEKKKEKKKRKADEMDVDGDEDQRNGVTEAAEEQATKKAKISKEEKKAKKKAEKALRHAQNGNVSHEACPMQLCYLNLFVMMIGREAGKGEEEKQEASGQWYRERLAPSNTSFFWPVFSLFYALSLMYFSFLAAIMMLPVFSRPPCPLRGLLEPV